MKRNGTIDKRNESKAPKKPPQNPQNTIPFFAPRSGKSLSAKSEFSEQGK